MVRKRIKRRGLRWEHNERNIRDVPRSCGVYKLFWGDSQCRIGKADNLRERLRQHSRDPNMRFGSFTWYETPCGQQDRLEADLIDKYWNELTRNKIRGRRR